MRNKNRTATIDWILQRDWELAITLTFKKDCTEHRARKTMRRLWNGIDRQLYHKAFKKQRKRVERVCAFEKGQSGTHYHYHIATSPSFWWVLEVLFGRLTGCAEGMLSENIKKGWEKV